ncbi:hypothetical protein D3C81_1589450 [compost metagenome]
MAITQFFDIAAFVSVKFIADLTDNLFKDILDGNQTGSSAVFIKQQGDMHTFFLHAGQQCFDRSHLGHGQKRKNQAFEIEFRIVVVLQIQLFGIDHPDNIVLTAIGNREAGVLLLADDFQIFFQGMVSEQANHVCPGHHDLFGQHFIEGEDTVHIAIFGFVDFTALIALGENQTNLIFAMRISMLACRLHSEHADQQVGGTVHQPNQRVQYLVEPNNQR